MNTYEKTIENIFAKGDVYILLEDLDMCNDNYGFKSGIWFFIKILKMNYFSKWKINIPSNPAISLLGIYPQIYLHMYKMVYLQGKLVITKSLK